MNVIIEKIAKMSLIDSALKKHIQRRNEIALLLADARKNLPNSSEIFLKIHYSLEEEEVTVAALQFWKSRFNQERQSLIDILAKAKSLSEKDAEMIAKHIKEGM